MKTGKMRTSTTSENCNVCGKKRKLTSFDQTRICSTCKNLVELFKKNPDAIRQISQLAGNSVFACPETNHLGQELPEVLDGVRYRTTDRESNTWYVSVSELEGNPVEIFASTAFDRDQHLQSRISNLTTITRLISLILRHIFMRERLTLDKTTTQLKRSSRLPNDLPDMLGKVLDNYGEKEMVLSEKETAIP